jgi:hypothetical protein
VLSSNDAALFIVHFLIEVMAGCAALLNDGDGAS